MLLIFTCPVRLRCGYEKEQMMGSMGSNCGLDPLGSTDSSEFQSLGLLIQIPLLTPQIAQKTSLFNELQDLVLNNITADISSL